MLEVLAGFVADFQAVRVRRTPSPQPCSRPTADATSRWDMRLSVVTLIIVFCLNFSAMIGRMVSALLG